MDRMLKSNTLALRMPQEGGENALGLNLFFSTPPRSETRNFQAVEHLSAEESFWDSGLNVTNSSPQNGVEGEEETFTDPIAAATCSENCIISKLL